MGNISGLFCNFNGLPFRKAASMLVEMAKSYVGVPADTVMQVDTDFVCFYILYLVNWGFHFPDMVPFMFSGSVRAGNHSFFL